MSGLNKLIEKAPKGKKQPTSPVVVPDVDSSSAEEEVAVEEPPKVKKQVKRATKLAAAPGIKTTGIKKPAAAKAKAAVKQTALKKIKLTLVGVVRAHLGLPAHGAVFVPFVRREGSYVPQCYCNQPCALRPEKNITTRDGRNFTIGASLNCAQEHMCSYKITEEQFSWLANEMRLLNAVFLPANFVCNMHPGVGVRWGLQPKKNLPDQGEITISCASVTSLPDGTKNYCDAQLILGQGKLTKKNLLQYTGEDEKTHALADESRLSASNELDLDEAAPMENGDDPPENEEIESDDE